MYNIVMIDKRTIRMLIYLADVCEDGSFKVIETADLTKAVSRKADLDTIRPILKFLQDADMIDIKYSDDIKYCVSVLPKGRVQVETHSGKKQEVVLGRRMARYIVLAAFVAAFAGALLAQFILNLLG